MPVRKVNELRHSSSSGLLLFRIAKLCFIVTFGHVALHGLLRGEEREHVEREADDHEPEGHGGEERLQVAVGRDERGDEDAEARADDHRADGSSARELGALARVAGHRAGERAVGDVDEAVGQAEGRVRQVGVEQHAALADLRDRERRDAEQQQRQRAEEDERPELAEPLAVRAVDDAAGEHVGERVEDPHDEQQRAGRGSRDARDVGVVDEQEHGGRREGQVVRRVAGAVADDAQLGELLLGADVRRCGGGAV